jgi:hypothetical protein
MDEPIRIIHTRGIRRSVPILRLIQIIIFEPDRAARIGRHHSTCTDIEDTATAGASKSGNRRNGRKANAEQQSFFDRHDFSSHKLDEARPAQGRTKDRSKT